MSSRISEDIKQIMHRLHDSCDDMSVAEIARIAGVSQPTAAFVLRKKINPYTGEPFDSSRQYQHYLVTQIINPETGEPFESINQYDNYRARQRQQQPRNIIVGHYIKQRLKEKGETQKWLEIKLGITTGTVSRYASGKIIPGKRYAERLFEALDAPYRSIDELVADNPYGIALDVPSVQGPSSSY